MAKWIQNISGVIPHTNKTVSNALDGRNLIVTGANGLGKIHMHNDDITAIKDSILKTVGEDCEKIILFGSYAYEHPDTGVTMIFLLS
jgi:hypothetical protein